MSGKAGKTRLVLMICFLEMILFIPALIFLMAKMGGKQYYLCGIIVIVMLFIPQVLTFERNANDSRRLAVLAVMSALAVVSRQAFLWLPFFKPILGIIMITGICMGPASGFLVGAVSAFVSNFYFGQGPWTPWQMLAYGAGGFIAGLILGRDFFKKKIVLSSIIGGLLILVFVGPLLDTSTLFLMPVRINKESMITIYGNGLYPNAMLGLATAVTILFLSKPLCGAVDRIRNKYGMKF